MLPSARDKLSSANEAETTISTAICREPVCAASLQYVAWWLDEATCLDACGPDAFDPSAITAHELEGLRWTGEGKTAWEVGQVLGISDQRQPAVWAT